MSFALPLTIRQWASTTRYIFGVMLHALLPEVESRTHGLRPRPRTQKKSEAKDSPSEDRHSRGQGRECSRLRTKDTNASVLKKRSPNKFLDDLKKKASKIFFRQSPKKKRFRKNFSADLQNFNHSKNSAVLEPRTGQISRN